MQTLQFDVQASSPEESNLFLRALWAALRRNAGKLGWQFTPAKDGPQRRVRFGFATVGDHHGVEIGVTYGKRGVAASLWVRHPDMGTVRSPAQDSNHRAPIPQDLEALFQKSVAEAVRNAVDPSEIVVSGGLRVSPDLILADYETGNLTLRGVAAGEVRLSLRIVAFDEDDAEIEFAAVTQTICIMLSAFTNATFIGGHLPPPLSEAASNRLWAPEAWLDDFPIVDGRLTITKDQLEFLDQVARGSVSEGPVLFAATHFHQALRLTEHGSQFDDAINTLLVSALEAISAADHEPGQCKECGQPRYAIRQRVRDLARRHLGAYVETLVEQAYRLRSSFLHAGVVRGKRPLVRRIQPLLDPASPTGCLTLRLPGDTKNLTEFTSFIIRDICAGVSGREGVSGEAMTSGD